jgi:DNA-binding NtrC family response regulator
VAVTNFISASNASLEALKTANLLKSLPINAFIFGQHGTGKKSLAKYILPDAPVVDATLYDELEGTLSSHTTVIISNFDKIPNYDNFQLLLDKYEVRIMALATSVFNTDVVERFFGIKVSLPPLSERPEDVAALSEYFLDEAKETLSVHNDVEVDLSEIDLSENAHSIRRHIYMQVQLQDIDEKELMYIMQKFLVQRLGGNNDYRNFLYLFEAPLINAGLEKFKTQLQLSDKLGLNRNTLRKKIAENKEYLKDE